MWKAINNYKSYIGIITGTLVAVVYQLGWIDQNTAMIAASVISGWTGVALKHSWDKKAKPK